MKYLRSLVFVAGAASLAALMPAAAQTIVAPGSSPAVRAMAERLVSDGARATGGSAVGEQQLVPLCADAPDAGDVLEAALIAGLDVYTAVRDTILACGRQGNAADVARAVAARALTLRGESIRYLVDGGVIAASAVIAERLKGGARVAADDSGQRRDLERERLERMMQKGLIDDEYRRYIDERRGLAATPAYPWGYDYGEFLIQPVPVVAPPYNPGGSVEPMSLQ